jgi:transposase
MAFYKYNRNQLVLFSSRIDERVPKSDKSRFIVQLVSQLNLDAIYARYSDQGNDAYPPDMMLALWFYAYSNGISSTRVLEELSRYDARYIYVSADLKPDHSTLSRFRKANLDLLEEYFVQLIKLSQRAKLSDFKDVSIDSTKLKACASKKQSTDSDGLSRKLNTIRSEIRDYMARCDRAESDAEGQADSGDIHSEIERLKRVEAKLVERDEQLEERKKGLKVEHRKNHQINLTDPDARFMHKAQGPAYNAQLVVDSKTHLVVAHDVVTDPNEQQQFSNMHQRCEANLGDEEDRKYNLDSGYHSTEQLEYAEDNKIDVVIADPTPENRSNHNRPTDMKILLSEKRPLQRSDFTYHRDEDYYQCPAGVRLTFLRHHKYRNRKERIYQSLGCHGCPLLDLCLPKKNKDSRRRIYRSEQEEYAERMRDKLKTDDAKERLQRRAMTVEPVFGNIKENLGFRGFSLRGLIQVKGEFILMCIAHNLNILYKWLGDSLLALNLFTQYIPYYAHEILLKTKIYLTIKFRSLLSDYKLITLELQ